LFAIPACGDDAGNGADAAVGDGTASGGDGGADAPAGSRTITLSGIAKEISTSGTTPLAGVMLTAYAAADDSVLGMATSAADGTFAISVTTDAAIDGYLKATFATTYKETYLYPPHVIDADYANVPVYVLSKNTYGVVNALLQNNQQVTNGWIGLVIEDAAQATVTGATVTSTPAGTVNYNGNSGLPSKTATSTAADGIAYDTNIAAGTVTVAAAKSGATFLSHAIHVRPDVVTLTLVAE
jgi:hypothetical protein